MHNITPYLVVKCAIQPCVDERGVGMEVLIVWADVWLIVTFGNLYLSLKWVLMVALSAFFWAKLVSRSCLRRNENRSISNTHKHCNLRTDWALQGSFDLLSSYASLTCQSQANKHHLSDSWFKQQLNWLLVGLILGLFVLGCLFE